MRPAHYANRPTATLQARRRILMLYFLPPTREELAELRAIDAELNARQVLSIGIDF